MAASVKASSGHSGEVPVVLEVERTGGRAEPSGMISLQQVLREHGPVLLVDTASEVVHGGWWPVVGEPRWTQQAQEASGGLFAALAELDVDLATVGAFVFCEGPGSNLGIRTAAVALRTWNVLRPRALFGYRSLELFATAGAARGKTLIVDARRQHWYALTVSTAGEAGPLERLAPDQLRPPLAAPSGFRHWSPLPAVEPETLPYAVPELWTGAMDRPLLRPTPEPDALMQEAPSYAAWTPQVHQAPRAN